MSAIRRRWRFTGTVQGVGFRYYARAAALHLGLTGWVANNWDGSVTLRPRASVPPSTPLSPHRAQQPLGPHREH